MTQHNDGRPERPTKAERRAAKQERAAEQFQQRLEAAKKYQEQLASTPASTQQIDQLGSALGAKVRRQRKRG